MLDINKKMRFFMRTRNPETSQKEGWPSCRLGLGEQA